ncbi:MAG: hypothetical protein WBM14_12575 [Terracidiphilus sp.]
MSSFLPVIVADPNFNSFSALRKMLRNAVVSSNPKRAYVKAIDDFFALMETCKQPICRALLMEYRANGEADRTPRPQSLEYDPPDWISTDQLETELWNAIMEDSSGSCDEDEVFEEIDDSLDDDDYEDEAEQRRSTLRLLSMMRRQLAELLGGPPAE